MAELSIEEWFKNEVLPLEPYLISYFRRKIRNNYDVVDRLHDVYEHAISGASKSFPANTKAYVLTIARNLIITEIRRSKIVSFDLVADINAEYPNAVANHDLLTPERHLSGRQDLQRAISGMDQLPPRCREAVKFRKLEGLSVKEIAQRQGISVAGVERQLTLGMRTLTTFMLGTAPFEDVAPPEKAGQTRRSGDV